MSLFMRTSCGFALSMVVLPLASSGLAGPPPADSSPAPLPAGSVVRLEIPDDPYLPPTAEPRPPSSGGPRSPRDPAQGVQVNVNDLGENIPGDAANEPSVAVDPTNPNNLVIGWRQFDNVASNFRQAGYAYSHDAVATPGGDLVSPFVLGGTMYVLFELTVLFIKRSGR